VSREGRTGSSGWVHLKGAKSMAVFGLSCRALVEPGRAICVLFGIHRVGISPKALIESSLIGGYG